MAECKVDNELHKELSRSLSLIRLDGKVPVEDKWQQYCHKRREYDDIGFCSEDNAGVACGPASGILVLDVDVPDRFSELIKEKGWDIPLTYTVKTRPDTQKCHLYYAYPFNGKTMSCRAYKEKVNGKQVSIFDVKATGGQVVAPGSIHPETGEQYKVVRNRPFAECPQWLVEFCSGKERKSEPQNDARRSCWDGTIDGLPISEEKKQTILSGEPKGGRSEAVIGVLNALVWAELTDNEIFSIFNRYAIGEKYREKGSNKDKWLNGEIARARDHVGNDTISNCPLSGLSTTQRTQQTHQNSAEMPFTQQPLSNHSARDTSDNLTFLIKEWILEGPGKFHVSEIDKEFTLTTRTLRNLRSRVVCDLQKDNKIERSKSKKGFYEVIDFECAKIDFKSRPVQKYNLWLPFNIHNMVKFFPKNIIMIAGEPNSGKTALLLNIVRHNMRDKKIFYFSSEMGSDEFNERISKFEDVNVDAWEFEPYERSENFHQVIRPDDFNIVDFLEVHKDFYEVGGHLRAIHDKLRNGICIVAIQKNPGSNTGLGGHRGLEKPRLYLSLSSGPKGSAIAEIVKAKSYIGPNCNGKVTEFRINDGWEIRNNTVWSYPERKGR